MVPDGFGMKSTAPASNASKVSLDPLLVSADNITIGVG